MCSPCARGANWVMGMLRLLWAFRSGRFGRGYRVHGLICGNSSTAADMNKEMSRFIEEREVSDVLDVMRAPADRDLPPGRLTERRRMLLAEITASQAAAGTDHPLLSRLRRIAGWFACLFAVVLAGLGASRAEIRPMHADHVAQVLAVAGAGAMIAVHAGAARGDGLHLGRQTPVGDARAPVPVAI
jgi:hypothetical protein